MLNARTPGSFRIIPGCLSPAVPVGSPSEVDRAASTLKAELGDAWVTDRHQLEELCRVMRLLESARAGLIITDNLASDVVLAIATIPSECELLVIERTEVSGPIAAIEEREIAGRRVRVIQRRVDDVRTVGEVLYRFESISLDFVLIDSTMGGLEFVACYAGYANLMSPRGIYAIRRPFRLAAPGELSVLDALAEIDRLDSVYIIVGLLPIHRFIKLFGQEMAGFGFAVLPQEETHLNHTIDGGGHNRDVIVPRAERRVTFTPCMDYSFPKPDPTSNIRISISVPTRGRAAKALRLIQSVERTADSPQDVEILLYVDLDDPAIEAYRLIAEAHEELYPRLGRVLCMFGVPTRVSRCWNLLMREARGDVWIVGNDDQSYQTNGWDRILLERLSKYPDGICCAWFNDGVNKETFATFSIVSRAWCNTVGYLMPEVLYQGSTDVWIYELGCGVGRLEYIPEVETPHEHFTIDAQYGDQTSHEVWNNPMNLSHGIVYQITQSLRQSSIEKLKAYIEAFRP